MDTIHFIVNGVECSVGGEVSSNTTLLDYIRNTLELRGTKYMCLEGGCGACIVSSIRPGGTEESVNSCLVPITSCHNWKITTIENIGNRVKGYHILQKTLAENNGTQCGYCSPGWVMAMYSLLKSKPLTMLEIEESLASNMCRCTGYRPIMDAFKKFASDAPSVEKIGIDIEDLHLCKDKCSSTCEDYDWCLISKSNLENIIHIKLKDDKEWFKVNTTVDVFSILNDKGDDSYMLVAGNTGKGVIPISEYPRILIDISGVFELKGYYFDQNLIIGAGNTLTELMGIFDTVSKNEYFGYLKVLNAHLKLVAHIPVRNTGTIAGNLMLKHKDPEFTSDVFLILQTVEAEITILQSSGVKSIISLDDFLKTNMRSKIIYNVLLPPLNTENHVVTYKIRRRAQNAHAMVNAGFLYTLNNSNQVKSSRIVITGLTPGYSRATKTEAFLVGKNLFTNETLQGAIKVLSNEIVVTDSLLEGSAEYRKRVAIGVFYKSLLYLCPKNILDKKYHSGALKLYDTRPVSNGQQFYNTDPSIWPLNQPIQKVEGLIQCAGEAKYTEDIPTIPGEVYAAFVLSTIGLGKINKIDASEALALKGVIAFYTADDIPGMNIFYVIEGSDPEVLLSNGDIQFYNQPVGIVVAETKYIAERAAELVAITYSYSKTPIIDIKITKNDETKTTLANNIPATKEGRDVARVIKDTNTLYGQYHFCYENIVCVAWPTEEGLAVRTATQCTAYDQITTAKVLNIDQNRIDVAVKRVGGAFGLKATRQLQVTAACNLVAFLSNRPCRFVLPLRTSMRTVGKRFSSSIDYEVGVSKTGIIQYVNFDVYEDNGYIVSEPLILTTYECYSNCYPMDKWNFRAFNSVTDKASNTYCRSPGALECIATNEIILERISYEMEFDPVELRLANLDEKHKPILTEMVEKLKTDANYQERKIMVDTFNKENRWKKRGLRFVLMKWNSVNPFYADVNISVYQSDGTVAIAHGGIEIGQGINTKIIQVCAYFLNIPIDKIIVKASDTVIAPNSSPTVGSATSQMIALSVQRACKELLNRLQPLREELNKPSWEELVKEAFDRGIDLQAHGFVNTADVQNLDIYGVTLAEVGIDVLTGEWTIIRVDLMQDVGRSVSPYIDIGQLEGAFIMGVGYYTTEELIYDPKTGELLSDRTWNYKILQARDIPVDFRVYFRPKSYSNDIVLGSKATGEPSTVMSVVIPIAMREAIVSARSDSGLPSNDWFQIDGPFTVEKICLATCTKMEDLKYY
ncbi:xanthine dehydrogenase 1-like [Colias croceus]|uniref:xanthine dehydrogenase 1-like n=1 Tax=Colias crocea TaxID=72248 RepID=UPI001E27F5CF|nr:xanthine dehydrogenase 1-like [Colias croceus]